MNKVNPEAFDFLLSQIKDGFIFEKLAQNLLCEIIGKEFLPVGGVKDRGIDGLDYTSEQSDDPATIYQMSIQADARAKIRNTLRALKDNSINCNRLFYVTTQHVRDQDKLMEEMYKEFSVNVVIRDGAWLRGNINYSEGTLRIYADFVENNTHVFNRPGSQVQVKDFSGDPRVFVFLRQQLDLKGADEKLDELLVDSLILFALEGTDPDKNIFRTRVEIFERIKTLAAFPISQIEELVIARLDVLSTKPRRINYHAAEDKYCLPYETRLVIDEQKIKDAAVYDAFNSQARSRMAKHLLLQKLRIKNADHLLTLTFNQIFKRQGLDFSNFMLEGESGSNIENALDGIIVDVMEAGAVADVNRQKVRLALLGTIRDVIYRGTPEELDYLQRLSRSYLMLFLLQCEPHVCAYFDALASKLRVFVCNSIIVPALSEICLEPRNRRHWNLLVQANKAGVELLINSSTLDELVSHISLVTQIYRDEYEGLESKYSDERTLMYVDKIIIRAYLYQLAEGDGFTFNQFLNKFVTPNASKATMAHELRTFLAEEFGITYVDDKSLGIEINESEYDDLLYHLKNFKPTDHQAKNDAKTILTVYGLREKDNEAAQTGVFGFRTWWLSKDTNTHKAVMQCFKNKRMSCYLRPDFMLSYITLTASFRQASGVFDKMFPTLVGVSISHHVDDGVSKAVHEAIREHKNLSASRVKAVIGTMSADLMIKAVSSKKELKHYLDEKLQG